MRKQAVDVVQKKTEDLVKGAAVLMIVWYDLFCVDFDRFQSHVNGISDLSVEISQKAGTFSVIGISMFIFLMGYRMAGQMAEKGMAKKRMEKCVWHAYLKLESDFFPVYLFVAATSFIGRNMVQTYGSGWKKWIYAILDAIGVQSIFDTPSLNRSWAYFGLVVVYLTVLPMLLEMYRKYDLTVLIFAAFCPYLLQADLLFWNYLVVLLFGVWCAREHVLERLDRYIWNGHETATLYGKIICGYLMLEAAVYIKMNIGLTYIMNSLIVFVLVYFCYGYILDIKGLSRFFAFFGKHSMNIWMLHTVVYRYFFEEQIYGLKYPLFIFIAVILISVLLSLLLQKVKILFGYDKIIRAYLNPSKGA